MWSPLCLLHCVCYIICMHSYDKFRINNDVVKHDKSDIQDNKCMIIWQKHELLLHDLIIFKVSNYSRIHLSRLQISKTNPFYKNHYYTAQANEACIRDSASKHSRGWDSSWWAADCIHMEMKWPPQTDVNKATDGTVDTLTWEAKTLFLTNFK